MTARDPIPPLATQARLAQAHEAYRHALRTARLSQATGQLSRVGGLLLESIGPACHVGDLCELRSNRGREPLTAEVVAVQGGRVHLMPHGDCTGLGPGTEVRALGQASQVPVSAELIGRVIDAWGRPLDGGPPIAPGPRRALHAPGINPLERPPITHVLDTGVRSIDALLTLGRGQRVGIFAGSGVGKSTLLGMVARRMQADVNVIALIGERGREVGEFIAHSLGPAGLARSVVVVASADQPAATRVRATLMALTVAEALREQGRHVLLTLDSITRHAMARREVGLALGEPATARGYTPSVLAELPRLLERCGTGRDGGSITALVTVLVEGDDLNDPVADALRAILDGHIVLSRELAQQGHYPAIDLMASVSRLLPVLASRDEQDLARSALAALALYTRNQPLIEVGAYRAGSHPALDHALRVVPALQAWSRQAVDDASHRIDALQRLRQCLGTV